MHGSRSQIEGEDRNAGLYFPLLQVHIPVGACPRAFKTAASFAG